MRRFIVPLMVGLIIFLTAGSVSAQIASLKDSLCFGDKIRDTLRAEPGAIVELPVFLSTDSTVLGVSMLFMFDYKILQPMTAYLPSYQALIDAGGFVPDSADYQASPVMDPGLWNCQLTVPTKILQTWDTDKGSAQVLYDLNNRGHARLLFTPNANIDSASALPYIRGELGDADGIPDAVDDGGGVIALLKFIIADSIPEGTITTLSIETHNDDMQTTELALKWDSAGLELTKAVQPTRVAAIFIAEPDTGGEEPPPLGTNHLPVLVLNTSQTVFDINPGQQVSFAVTATDAEGGELRIKANNGNLPPNASFGTAGLVVGGGGVATGTFSFVPDVSQQGSYNFTFIATDDSSASSAPKSVTVTVAKPDVDILFTTSADGLAPNGGVPGLTEVIVPINVVTNNIIYGIQFDMNYDANHFDLDSVFTSDRAPEWMIYDNVGVDPGFLRVVAFGLANDSMVAGTTSAALYLAFSVDEFAEIGGYPLDIYNAWESINPDPNVPSLEFETNSGILYVDRWGDVNLDRRIDVADLVSTVAYIIGTYDLSRRQFATADLVTNDVVNVVDLVGIINTIFGLPIESSPAPEQEYDESAYLKIAHEEIPGAGVESEMQVQADMPVTVAGVELEIKYNPQAVEMLAPRLADASDGFRINYRDNGAGYMKVLIYSDHPWNEQELIQRGLADIIRLPFVSRGAIDAGDTRQVRITKAYVSTGAAKNVAVEGVDSPVLPDHFELYQNRPNPFNPVTTIDFYIDGGGLSGAEQVTLEVFNILGQKVKNLLDDALAPGQYSVVWDGTDENGEHAASGIYLYRLKVGDANKTKKMMLLK